MLRAIAVWLVIMIAESIHGTIRTLYLEPRMGSIRARQMSVFTGCLMIFAITYLFGRWIGQYESRKLLVIGLVWILLTLAFEIAAGVMLGFSAERMAEDYDLARGGLMIPGLAFMLLTPLLAARLRGMKREAKH